MGPGLSSDDAAARLALHGPNELPAAERRTAWSVWRGQFEGPMPWILSAAAALSVSVGHFVDAAAIAAILALNAVVGFLQEFRAERSLAALRSLTAPRARVVRDGVVREVAARLVVPGDRLALEAGDLVAADARLLEAHALRTVEAALTGESTPVDKRVGGSAEGAALADRRGDVFLGTAVAAGRGVAEVVGTGGATEMGAIARMLQDATSSETPLQAQLRGVGRALLLACLAVVALVSTIELLRGRGTFEVLLSSTALAVAAVPEGLPTIVTIALALGVRRMAARNALVRRLASVETLGSVTVVCTDKTGTLTTGSMELREVWARDRHALLHAAAACCDATLGEGPGVGDPTELALLRAAAGRGIHREAIERDTPRVAETPFDADRKRMSVWRADGVLYVKGAPEVVAPLCVEGTGGAEEAARDMAARGLRVLAVATGAQPGEHTLRLLGLAGLADPPRAEARDAIASARAAGVRVLMITGDHAGTAEAVAREIGLVSGPAGSAEGVHARATAEDKLAIVRGLKAAGEVVAMTGDGVNDAPALREAHIGVAMGRTGTEVTREASDMVLTDDNFATIVAAIEEGRAVYDNIRKALLYLLTGNSGELAVMLGAAAVGLPLPLLPLQLLWINLVTDGLPALALVTDPPEPGVMRRRPRAVDQPMLDRAAWAGVLGVAALEAGVVLGAFAWAAARAPLAEARTFAFTTLVFSELLRVFAARSAVHLYWQVGVLSNLHVVWVAAVSALVQVALPYVPLTARLFDVVPLRPEALATAAVLGLVPVSAIEVRKLTSSWRNRHA
ncbi:MAG: cation-translocating P-type ATPase [Vicinamibacteria bacterium]